MKSLQVLLVSIAIAIPALAQKGGGGHASGGGSRASAPATSRSQSGRTANTSRFAAPKATNTSRSVAIPNPQIVHPGVTPIVRTTTSVVVVHNNCCRFWWGGGVYLGSWYYGPGWYSPWAVAPGYWYWNGWAGYQYNYAPYAAASGIKFDLEQIPKSDKKAVDEAGVYLPSEEGENGYLGKVGSFSGRFHRSLPLSPGTYDVAIALADGREIAMSVTVQPQRVTHVALRLGEPPESEANKKLVPAKPPEKKEE
jgi:hypothetical protein